MVLMALFRAGRTPNSVILSCVRYTFDCMTLVFISLFRISNAFPSSTNGKTRDAKIQAGNTHSTSPYSTAEGFLRIIR